MLTGWQIDEKRIGDNGAPPTQVHPHLHTGWGGGGGGGRRCVEPAPSHNKLVLKRRNLNGIDRFTMKQPLIKTFLVIKTSLLFKIIKIVLIYIFKGGTKPFFPKLSVFFL